VKKCTCGSPYQSQNTGHPIPLEISPCFQFADERSYFLNFTQLAHQYRANKLYTTTEKCHGLVPYTPLRVQLYDNGNAVSQNHRTTE